MFLALDDQLQFLLIVEQGALRLLPSQVQGHWRELAIRVPEISAGPYVEIEVNRVAVELRVLESAGQILALRPLFDERCQRRSNGYVKWLGILK